MCRKKNINLKGPDQTAQLRVGRSLRFVTDAKERAIAGGTNCLHAISSGLLGNVLSALDSAEGTFTSTRRLMTLKSQRSSLRPYQELTAPIHVRMMHL